MTAVPEPDDVEAVTARCLAVLDAPETLVAPKGYPDSLALCLVDSIQSPGVKYSVVESVVDRYRQFRRSQGANADTDGADNLAQSFVDLDGIEGWMAKIGTRNRTPARPGAPFKADAIRIAAETFQEGGLLTTADLRETAASPEGWAQVNHRWVQVIGQKSGVTWHYVLMLAGVPGVKPDRMIIRFVANGLGVGSRTLTPEYAAAVVTAAAEELNISPTTLDHAIWSWQRQAQRKPTAFGDLSRVAGR